MPSSTTAIGRIELIDSDDLSWRDQFWDSVRGLTKMSKGVVVISAAAGRALTSTNYVDNEYRQAVLWFKDGSLVASQTFTVPGEVNKWWIINGEAVSFTFGVSGGVSVVVPAGRTVLVTCDGTDCRMFDPVASTATSASAAAASAAAALVSELAAAASAASIAITEGTWTPAFSATGCTFSYASQVGHYTRIDNRVWLTWRIQLNTSGNTLAANVLSITGLPFANANTVADTSWLHWSSTTASYVCMEVILSAGTSSMTVTGITAASTAMNTTVLATNGLHATNGTTMSGQINYKV